MIVFYPFVLISFCGRMEKKKIVDEFFKHGALLTPELLDGLSSESDEYRNQFISKKHSDFILQHKPPTENIKIIKNLTEKPPATKEDHLKFYTSMYEKMRAIITERLQKNFVSLNKLTSFRDEVFVIGIVKDIREEAETKRKIVEIEDTTTTTSVIFNQDAECELDDVVAIQAISGGKVLFGKKILYPDIPLRKPATGHGRACFVSDLHINQLPKKYIEKFFAWIEQENIDALFVAGDVGDFKTFEELCGNKKTFLIPGNADTDEEYPYLPKQTDKKNITSLSNPAIIYFNGLKILLVHDFNIEMLKKRHIGKSSVILPEDFLALDDVPDIVHYGHTHKPFVSNYKSTTLINSGSPLTNFMPVIVDFQTRDWKQVEFNIV